ncbi:hypothetical protein [Kushneria phosphatilytica]|uniref:Carboxypeptidase regulatory-like domain-containing protein n=1 Tax=Kushneria phosphatilytica TaxID=657387 RepID=A0A1S1NU71_9GAMM|nr:hypothetical protein [Kushneria phosphatilytica]OHV08979.1 hypothetical protein BH688_11485 [Kushneria phosphatilytica]QEL12369.1 carboxypeptidase regulatory-like domain-containing protein [Kushneria phosphatilytica]
MGAGNNRRTGKVVVTVALLLALSGCQSVQRQISEWLPGTEKSTGPVVRRQVPFPAQTYAALPKSGIATVKGRLFYQRPEGGTVYGDHEQVSIAPVTEYSAEAASQALAGKRVEPADPRARAYTHTTTTDSRGYFSASGIPAGVFYVAGTVALPGGGRSPFILKQVRVRKDSTVEVELSR